MSTEIKTRDVLAGVLLGAVLSLVTTIGAQHITIVEQAPEQDYDQCRSEFSRNTRCFSELSAGDCLKLIDHVCGEAD